MILRNHLALLNHCINYREFTGFVVDEYNGDEIISHTNKEDSGVIRDILGEWRWAYDNLNAHLSLYQEDHSKAEMLDILLELFNEVRKTMKRFGTHHELILIFYRGKSRLMVKFRYIPHLNFYYSDHIIATTNGRPELVKIEFGDVDYKDRVKRSVGGLTATNVRLEDDPIGIINYLMETYPTLSLATITRSYIEDTTPTIKELTLSDLITYLSEFNDSSEVGSLYKGEIHLSYINNDNELRHVYFTYYERIKTWISSDGLFHRDNGLKQLIKL